MPRHQSRSRVVGCSGTVANDERDLTTLIEVVGDRIMGKEHEASNRKEQSGR
jgi:hypothetical protein